MEPGTSERTLIFYYYLQVSIYVSSRHKQMGRTRATSSHRAHFSRRALALIMKLLQPSSCSQARAESMKHHWQSSTRPIEEPPHDGCMGGLFRRGSCQALAGEFVTQMACRMTSLLPIEYYYYKVIVFYAS